MNQHLRLERLAGRGVTMGNQGSSTDSPARKQFTPLAVCSERQKTVNFKRGRGYTRSPWAGSPVRAIALTEKKDVQKIKTDSHSK